MTHEPETPVTTNSTTNSTTAATAYDNIVIFDTNVLLTEPSVLFEHADAEIIIPETVLGELDKLKTARVDPDLRFRGREVSRLIFELAQDGSLIDGVDLPDGGRLRVFPFDYSGLSLPDGFTTKSPDDKILATAYLICHELCRTKHVTLITNDLNMLLKAQTYDIPVEQYGNGNDVSFTKRYIVRPFQRYRVPLTILGISLAVFAGVVLIALSSGAFNNKSTTTAMSTEFRNILTADQQKAYDALNSLQNNAQDYEALKVLATFYYDRADAANKTGDMTPMVTDAKVGITYYTRYLAYQPDDQDARNDMAVLYYYSGDTDRAIQEVTQVLSQAPKNAMANYNLGMFYFFGRGNFDGAREQMEKVIKMTEGDATQRQAYDNALGALERINAAESTETTATPAK